MNGAEEKVKLEHEAARIFMRLYQQRSGIKMQHIWHNEPARPDVSCYYEDTKLDLEIAHLYGSEVEAMQILGRTLSAETHRELMALLRAPPAHRLLTALNRIISSKAEKHYESANVWLVIRNANPLWTGQDVLSHLDKLHLPKQHPFSEIWLVGDMAGESGILPIFPATLRQGGADKC
jgi:hypothetical protein